ncbi:hypothetical protein [Faecalibacter sp. LW9]|uniref:hypothetical protein n=1 Tax=Faecalibacter sp. LW9 TaxID=3103144 RepID=UPI002AFF5FF8|nr:hypothetical protein [Faecalibacter sp. LW9]
MSKNLTYTTPLLLSDEDYDKIEQMAAMNYTVRQMALYLEQPFIHFNLLAHEKTSEVYVRITRGRLQTDFEIDQSLQENAKKGNLTAIQQREKNKEQKRIEDIKANFFG